MCSRIAFKRFQGTDRLANDAKIEDGLGRPIPGVIGLAGIAHVVTSEIAARRAAPVRDDLSPSLMTMLTVVGLFSVQQESKS